VISFSLENISLNHCLISSKVDFSFTFSFDVFDFFSSTLGSEKIILDKFHFSNCHFLKIVFVNHQIALLFLSTKPKVFSQFNQIFQSDIQAFITADNVPFQNIQSALDTVSHFLLIYVAFNTHLSIKACCINIIHSLVNFLLFQLINLSKLFTFSKFDFTTLGELN
jgi:hypothetical protein